MPGMDTPFAIGSDTWPGLSKLVEEMGELTQVLGKLIATGGDELHWDGTNLRVRMIEEMADVVAALVFYGETNDLDLAAVMIRAEDKLALFKKWHVDQQAPHDISPIPQAEFQMGTLHGGPGKWDGRHLDCMVGGPNSIQMVDGTLYNRRAEGSYDFDYVSG